VVDAVLRRLATGELGTELEFLIDGAITERAQQARDQL